MLVIYLRSITATPVDARLNLERKLASGVVSLTSQTRLLPIVVPSKRTELSRPEPARTKIHDEPRISRYDYAFVITIQL